MDNSEKLKKLKSGLLTRSLSLAKLGLNAGIGYASAKVTGKPMNIFLNEQAQQLTDEFGKLKGSIMKAGQMLSVYGEHFLPPEANAILKKLQSESTVVSWDVMEQQLHSQLSDELIEKLEINTEPVGSASMGQVYSAIEKSSQKKLALKIQFPDVDKAIESDVAALKRILKLSGLLPSEIKTDGLFAEIKEMLYQELDYKFEAQKTMQYSALVDNNPLYKVPQIQPDYCSEKVLAMEYIEGLKPDHSLIKGLSQERRNRLAINFLDLYFKELFEWNCVQTDPHLGNYKIQIDSYGQDRLVLFDFGAVKEFSPSFIQNYRRLIKGAVINDQDLFLTSARNLGFINSDDSAEYIKHFTEFCNETVEAFLRPDDPRNVENKINSDGTYDWKKTDLPQRVIQGALRFKKFKLRTPPRELVFLDRKTAGVFIFLNSLECRINAEKVIRPYLEKV